MNYYFPSSSSSSSSSSSFSSSSSSSSSSSPSSSSENIFLFFLYETKTGLLAFSFLAAVSLNILLMDGTNLVSLSKTAKGPCE